MTDHQEPRFNPASCQENCDWTLLGPIEPVWNMFYCNTCGWSALREREIPDAPGGES